MSAKPNVSLRGSEIHIWFRYDPERVALIRTLPDRKYDGDNKVWTMPATAWHARQLIDKLSGGPLEIGEDVRHLASQDQRDWNHSTLDLSVGDLRPRPYQAGAVEFLQHIGGRGIIGDDVGLGKTIEAISYCRFIGIDRFLVVSPASVLYKWEREIKLWYPEVANLVHVIPTGKTSLQVGTIHIISYDLMRRMYRELRARKYKLLIFDEVHKIRNHKTLQCEAAKTLASGIPYILGLTGTPMFNRPRELFNILNILDDKAWQWYPFFSRYCGWHKGGSADGAFHLDELAERLRGIMLRRFKRDVLDQIPPITRTVVPIHLSEEAIRNYRLLEQEDPGIIQRLFPNGKGYFTNHLDWLAALRQFLEQCRAQSVADWAEDFLEASEGKLVIYCGYKSTVKFLREFLEKWGVLEITGEISNKDRQTINDRWQNTRHERVMLLTSAGGEGIDLFGKNGIDCSTILFAGRDWSPESERQVEGRLDRLGQTFPVEAVYLVCQNTIDEDIARLIESKRETIRDVVRVPDADSRIVSDLVEVLRLRGITKKARPNG